MIATLFFLLGQQPPPPPSPPKPPPPPWRRGVGQCATEPCNGGNAGCSGNLCLGDGDCDADEDCVAGLLCGVDNCAAFRNSDGWPMDEEVWDQTDDCCYSPGGLGSPNPLTATFKTCDVEDAQTNGLTLLHSAPGVFFGDQTRGVRRTQVLSQSDLGIDAPIRAVSLTALTSDGWCVENITANGDLLDGLYGVWLDNPVQDGNYNRYPAFTTYTWRVPNPSNVIEFSWSTCDVSNGQTHGTLLLHLSEVRLMDSQTRNQVTTFQVPAETRALSLTATTSDGWCVEVTPVPTPHPHPSPLLHLHLHLHFTSTPLPHPSPHPPSSGSQAERRGAQPGRPAAGHVARHAARRLLSAVPGRADVHVDLGARQPAAADRR